MNREIALRLASELTSGRYRQGRMELRSQTETFCAIGVLTDMYVMEGNGEWIADEYGLWGIEENSGINTTQLSHKVAEWAGVGLEDVEITLPSGRTLMELNDELLYSFGDIARELRSSYAD